MGPDDVWYLITQASNMKQMEGEVSKLTTREIEEWIRELEHAWAESFGNGADVSDLHPIRRTILELQQELGKRKTN